MKKILIALALALALTGSALAANWSTGDPSKPANVTWNS